LGREIRITVWFFICNETGAKAPGSLLAAPLESLRGDPAASSGCRSD
jgi:hypothetical protein